LPKAILVDTVTRLSRKFLQELKITHETQKMSKIGALGDSLSDPILDGMALVSGRRVTGFFHPKRIIFNITVK